ncbi:DUF502 domain-containing protein [Falsiroseomonas oryziterrae]|uniref:hypothetical protein n=1 Tax=Falsiroseomonas oryziterrae TaxID=2911368 RepID=UPI001F17D110|nr:hypothetical protein [Roseomonas sp. NPKOSM-4]
MRPGDTAGRHRAPGGPFILLRRVLIEGALVVLPIGAVVLLVLGLIGRIERAADPLTGHVLHPALVAIGGLLLICLLVGAAIRSATGRRMRALLEGTLLDRLPGYRLAKAFATDGPWGEGSGRAVRPALAAIEDGLCPALVMDEFADGRLVVFVPGAPAPMAGAIYVFAPEKVTLLDVPLLPFLKTISSWGLGLVEMIEAAERARTKEAAA